MLDNKNIIVAVGGGIAAYKSAELIRLLRQHGAHVQVIMTPAAKQFITPLTLQALSGNAVRDNVFSLEAENAMGHIELARWPDLIVIAPATANIIAQLSHGFADDLLSTVCLATRALVALVPAMNQAMWLHPMTQRNVKNIQLHELYSIWGPDHGTQACGDIGPGRMLESHVILEHIVAHFQSRYLSGKKVLITAGPTREALDPVRCLTNISSGKMGYALAQAARDRGAEVILVSGPTALSPPVGVQYIPVESALSMCVAVEQHLAGTDIFIGAAAVSDYRPLTYSDQKMKKIKSTSASEVRTIEVILNPDIIHTVACSPQRPRCVVGFAAETENDIAYATQKLHAKKMDFILVNRVGDGQGCESDNNTATLINADGVVVQNWPLMPKRVLANAIFDIIKPREITEYEGS